MKSQSEIVRQLTNEIIDESDSINSLFYNKEDKEISDKIDDIEYELAKIKQNLYDMYYDLGKDIVDNHSITNKGKILISNCENIRSKIDSLEKERKILHDKQLYYSKLFLKQRWR